MGTEQDMTDRSDEYREWLRESLDWVGASEAKQEMFLERMRGYNYGRGPLIQAWCWWSHGFEDSRQHGEASQSSGG